MEIQDVEKLADEYIQSLNNRKAKAEAKRQKEILLESYKGDDNVISFEEIYENEKDVKYEYISTGHQGLDEALGGGIKTKELIVISGFTGNGKTSFCFDLTRNMKSQNCFWLPFEESANEFARKNIIWRQEPIHFYTPAKIVREDIGWIEERILEAVIKYQSKVVFIDNLHFITMGEEFNQFAKQGTFTKELKRIADRLDVAIVLIAHLRKSKEGIHKMPTFEDISGSSDVVKLANKVITVWREAKKNMTDGSIEYSGFTKVGIQKVREANGKLTTLNFKWDKGVYTEDNPFPRMPKYEEFEF